MYCGRYGEQLQGCTKKSNRNIIQSFQNKMLRCILDASLHVRSDDIHMNLKVASDDDEVQRFATIQEDRPHTRLDIEMMQLLKNAAHVRQPDTIRNIWADLDINKAFL